MVLISFYYLSFYMKRKIARSIFTILILLITGYSLAGQPQPAACREAAATFTDAVLQRTNRGHWLEWIESLSGAQWVTIGGEDALITTRYSPAMFDGYSNARAFEYVLEQVRSWYPEGQIEIDPFSTYYDERTQIWKNLIVTIPGTVTPGQEVILSAHLDSVVYFGDSPYLSAPGAEDNASGSAALLEAARLLRGYRFKKTIKIIWFTGEEQGMRGSKAYVIDHNISGVVGNINLDMFGYDSDNDQCFELHVGGLSQSQALGNVFAQAARTYSPMLSWDTIITPMTSSDHSSFWSNNIAAIEILENFQDHYSNENRVCQGADRNPNYHRPSDTTDKLNLDSGFNIVRAALATVIELAEPVSACLANPPVISSIVGFPLHLQVTWNPLPQAQTYEVYRTVGACDGKGDLIASLSGTSLMDGLYSEFQPVYYQVVGIGANGACVSLPSVCQAGTAAQAPFHFRMPSLWH